MSKTPEVYVSFARLPEYGVRYCRVHLRRLIARKKFPAPYRLSDHRIAWRLSEISDWLASRPRAGEVRDDRAAR